MVMHTSVKRATACLIFALALGLTACSPAEDFALKQYAPTSADASIKEVSLGTSDTNKFDDQRVATQFPAGTKKVLVWYRWEGADKDKEVAIHWSLDGTPVLQQGEALGKESGSAAWTLQLGAGGDLPSAGYKVELLENGAVVATIPFQVGGAGAAAPVVLAQATSPTSPDDAPVPMAEAPVPMAETPAPVAQAAAPTGPAVLASADGEKSGVRVEVTELKRSSGDTVNLKFVLINDSDEQFAFYGHYLGDSAVRSDHKSVGGVHLVDPAGKKKYLVVRDAEEKCVCSTDLADAKPKTRVNLWAKFPAPPAGVQKISIVIPHFSPMDDVPISQ